MIRLVLLLALCWPLVAQTGTLDFAPQYARRHIVKWGVSGCADKPASNGPPAKSSP